MSSPAFAFGPCNGCAPQLAADIVCLNSLSAPTSAAGTLVSSSFGNMPSGTYLLVYCGGGTQTGQVNGADGGWPTLDYAVCVTFSQGTWDVTARTCSYPGSGVYSNAIITVPSFPGSVVGNYSGLFIQGITDGTNSDDYPGQGTLIPYNSIEYGVPFLQQMLFAPTATSSGSITYQIAAEYAGMDDISAPSSSGVVLPGIFIPTSACGSALIYHTGGDISIRASGLGGVTPTIGLYQVDPDISFSSPCAQWTTAGSIAQLAITLLNGNNLTWYSVTATLDNSGGISGAVAQSVQNLDGFWQPGTAQIVIPFDCSTADVTATLRLKCPYWTNDVTFEIYLGPLVSLAPQVDTTCENASGSKLSAASWTATYIGVWWINNCSIELQDNSGNLLLDRMYAFTGGRCSPASVTTVNGISNAPCSYSPITFDSNRFFGTDRTMQFTFTDEGNNAAGAFSVSGLNNT